MQQIYILLCGFQSTNSDRFSGDGYEDPPVPISNTVVKLINAESTWLETAWEDRKPLIDVKAHLRVCLFFVWIFILLRELMSKAVDVEGVTYIISINYRALKHIFFSWIWYT